MAIAAFLSAALTLSLGFWQLRRAAEKQDFVRAMQVAQNAPPLSVTIGSRTKAPRLYCIDRFSYAGNGSLTVPFFWITGR
ncbi:SURF1 family cytochrome oxidase biogenesis protein [Rhodoferax sp. TBRC 17660]|uniref:SURF1-like protein n=1 Tax=Rhodoferax potami TaxID=3068338 RepID=A0ABU3KP05_9BURK|nr:SURF1 family cytochrome oxidase biogenesis protein [Rhodoferax sp. TBRC 17660]MDT7519510.1 SURF1 family cytochrome oxidase biogenesis protein [Rhodoferax sp. TBRC 17660]